MAQVEDRFSASLTRWRLVETERPGWHFARRSHYRRFTQGVGVTLGHLDNRIGTRPFNPIDSPSKPAAPTSAAKEAA
jgi:hypothetical protein